MNGNFIHEKWQHFFSSQRRLILDEWCGSRRCNRFSIHSNGGVAEERCRRILAEFVCVGRRGLLNKACGLSGTGWQQMGLVKSWCGQTSRLIFIATFSHEVSIYSFQQMAARGRPRILATMRAWTGSSRTVMCQMNSNHHWFRGVSNTKCKSYYRLRINRKYFLIAINSVFGVCMLRTKSFKNRFYFIHFVNIYGEARLQASNTKHRAFIRRRL